MHYRRHIIYLIALLGAGWRHAYASPAGRPQALRLDWDEIYLRTETQFENDRQTAGQPGSVFSRTETIIEPSVGLGLQGSVYHPHLDQIRLNAELGGSWEATQTSPGGGYSGAKLLQRYVGSVDLLNQKPYATSLYGNKDMTYRDYDFFSRVRLESQAYGARTGYAAGPVPFTFGVEHHDETELNAARPRDFKQDTMAFNAQNQRHRFNGTTRLSANLTDFTRRDDGFNTTHGLSQNINLADSEDFGPRRQAQLNSLLNYTSLTDTLVPTDQLLAQESLRLEHTRKLDSFYSYSFNNSTAGDARADSHDVHAGLNYQYRPDLSAGLDATGDRTRSASPGSSLLTKSYGTGVSAQYTPALSPWARLMVNDGARWDHQNREAGGLTQTIIGEAHTLTDGAVLLLAQPGVAAGTVHVWGDPAHTISYVEGSDYILNAHGLFTEIRRITGGTILNGSVIYVDYSATLQGSAAYDTLANSANFRLDLWNGWLGLYGHWSVQAYEGGENLLLRSLNDKTIGVDSVWRWFRVSAEYEVVDSNLSPFDRTRFTQSATFHPGRKTEFSLNLDEGWTDFNDNHVRQTSYGCIGRLAQQFTAHLSGGTEAGVQLDRGDTFDRTLSTCRLWLDWNLGRLTVKASYEFNDEYHLSDRADRHYVYLSIRRDFK